RGRDGGGEALTLVPAVVGPGRQVVDLLPGPLPHVVDEDGPGPRVHGEGERVAEAQRVDELVDAGGLPDERVVAGDQLGAVGRVGRGDLGAVGAHLFAERFAGRWRVGGVGFPAHGEVELPGGAEGRGPAVVVGGGAERVEVKDVLLAAGRGHV